MWTGYSFKAPLLASAVACLVGNLAYSLSYDARALWLLVLARLITGLGAKPPHWVGMCPHRGSQSVWGKGDRVFPSLQLACMPEAGIVCPGQVVCGGAWAATEPRTNILRSQLSWLSLSLPARQAARAP